MVDYVQKHYRPYIEKYNFLFDDLKFRINALRELFEETGILLYRDMKSTNETDEQLEYPKTTKMCSFDQILEWRQKVMNDPFEFEQLFRSIHLVPDILCLVPWARIQTPWRTGRRWDARFYLALIDTNNINDNVICAVGKEIESIGWEKICDQMMKEKKYPPPTAMKLMELNTICNKEKVLMEEYKTAFFSRNVKAIRPKFAFCQEFEKGALIIWNRDYLYDQLDLDEVEFNMDYEENEKNMHRYRIYFGDKGRKQMEVAFTFDRMYGQLAYKNPA